LLVLFSLEQVDLHWFGISSAYRIPIWCC
jgi:hypothetical protein